MNRTSIVLGTIFLIVSFTAVPSAGSDLIGLYFDEAGTDNCHLEGLYEPVSIYLVPKLSGSEDFLRSTAA